MLALVKFAADGALEVMACFIVNPLRFGVVYVFDVTFVTTVFAMVTVFASGPVGLLGRRATIAACKAATVLIDGRPATVFVDNVFDLTLVATVGAVGRIGTGGFMLKGFALFSAAARACRIAASFAIGHPNLLLFMFCLLDFALVAAFLAHTGVSAGLPVVGKLAGIPANGADFIMAGFINALCFKCVLGLFGFIAALAAIVSAFIIAPLVGTLVGRTGNVFCMYMPHRTQHI